MEIKKEEQIILLSSLSRSKIQHGHESQSNNRMLHSEFFVVENIYPKIIDFLFDSINSELILLYFDE